jgi:chemotaxis protein MotC
MSLGEGRFAARSRREGGARRRRDAGVAALVSRARGRPASLGGSAAATSGAVRFPAGAGCLATIWVLVGLAAIVPCRAEPPAADAGRAAPARSGAQLYELVRSLETLQDKIVLGDADAQAKLPKLVGQIAAAIPATDPKAWEDPRNLRAVIVYGASGGQPRAIRAVAELGVASGETKILLDGVLAYAEGYDAQARQILAPVEAMSLPVPLAGHIAMIQANLAAAEDLGRARQLLARARVLAPGTLIEEASLRKEVFLADQAGDLRAFASLSGQYIRRFPRSAYAENFRQRFRLAVPRFGLTDDAAQFATVETVLGLLGDDEQIELLLATARNGLVGGAVEPARRAAEKVAGMVQTGTGAASRANLYMAALHVLTGQVDAGIGDLEGLETTGLSKQDRDLATALRMIVSKIRVEPANAEQAGAVAEPGNGASGGREHTESAAASQTIRRAGVMLDEVGKLLGRKTP